MKRVSLILLVVLFVLSLQVEAKNTRVLENYATIQKEINGASSGDTLCTVTIHSLPSGATVYIEKGYLQNISQSEPIKVGKTPLKLKLPMHKHYIIWLEMVLSDYREITKSIPSIQKSLDKFERNQEHGRDTTTDPTFFENYTGTIIILYKIGDINNRLAGVRIPNNLQTDREQERICGVFIPEGMNPDRLLSLVKERDIYWWNKKGFYATMRRYDAPDSLIERSYKLFLRTGTALLIYPIKTDTDEIPQEIVLHIIAPPPGGPDSTAAVGFSKRPASIK